MSGEAGANADAVHFAFLTVGSARVGIAGIQVFDNWFSGRWQMAFSRSISDVPFKTRAFRHMIEHVTDGVDSAGARTRIFTLGVDASEAGGAVSVQDTFRSAGKVWVAEKSWQTFASSCTA
jgi:hypothetical protein